MTKAYLVGQITITNPVAYATYAGQVPQTIEAFGGKYLVRGGHSTQLEGQPQGERQVVVEFPNRETAEAWYHSHAYQAILSHRTNNSIGTIAIVDGYDT
ncbi:hypothetical protein LMORI2_09400 [Limnohabitans sp. MORI2]|jgi:uncharacterized protein (DUF1330 family)|uniref:DUF1330 domain-containing protein n=1 Tax=Limnohabitans sp. MORI2 TaxID=1751150 RepID=UPI002377C8DC|nr:DUF1330 domain-containing protein [Limnohabitans sp. MORI2]BDU57958.1 hypothetical protein LMORI2_09400 [Limnohabitans sp. MORI2]